MFQSLLPQHCLSRLSGWIARCEWPWLKNILIRKFIRDYQVDVRSALKEDPRDYRHFNAFFTRPLKSTARPIASETHIIVAPVDGRITQYGDIQQGSFIQAKGLSYSLSSLLGGSEDLAAQFQNGKFSTFYLAPGDYHRVHSPCDANLREMIYVPGSLFSVNLRTTAQLPGLFSRNERVITLFTTPAGPMAVILVGAMLVASISTVWAGLITPDHSRKIRHFRYPENAVVLKKGVELGRFQLGSTVILLFSANHMAWSDHLTIGEKIHFGQRVGYILE